VQLVPGRIAGTIAVTCAEAAPPAGTRVTVRYDVTSLGAEGAAFVEELEAGYDHFLESWRRAILGGAGERRKRH